MKKYLGELGLLAVTAIWGMGFVASWLSLDSRLTPFQILTLRFFISALLMVIIYRKKLKLITLDALKPGIVLGLFLYLGFAFQTIGLQFTTPSKNAFLTAVNVVIVPFISVIFFRKPIDRFGGIGAVMACAGAGILTLDGSLNVNPGDLLTLVCAVGFALHIFFVGEYVKKYDPIVLTLLQLSAAFVFSLASMVAAGQTHIVLNVNGICAVLYLGLFSTLLAFILQNVSQKYTTQTRAAIILSMESVFGALSSVVFLGERLSLRIVAGCLLILAAIVISETKLSFVRGRRADKGG